MRKKIESSRQWDSEFDLILRHIADVRSAFEKRKSSESSELLLALHKELTAIEQICDNLKYYFCRNPIDKFIAG